MSEGLKESGVPPQGLFPDRHSLGTGWLFQVGSGRVTGTGSRLTFS